jgi:hypothetical protein
MKWVWEEYNSPFEFYVANSTDLDVVVALNGLQKHPTLRTRYEAVLTQWSKRSRILECCMAIACFV